MLKDLIKLANHLDSKGYTKEADIVDSIIKRSKETGFNFSDIDFKNIDDYDTELSDNITDDEDKEFGVGLYIDKAFKSDDGSFILDPSISHRLALFPMSESHAADHINTIRRNIEDSDILKVEVRDSEGIGSSDNMFKSIVYTDYGLIQIYMFVIEKEEVVEENYNIFTPSDTKSFFGTLKGSLYNGEEHVLRYLEAISNTLEK